MSARKITFGDIMDAAIKPTIDEACAYLQDKGGITDGGIAGQVFHDMDDHFWRSLSPGERCTRLEKYVRIEISFECKGTGK